MKNGRIFMSPVLIIKKLVILCAKIKNPPYFWYMVYHYLRRDIPAKKAVKICSQNILSYQEDEKDLIIHTYDRSNQSVHPDTIFFKDKYWLVITPYPYGMEEYENPCLYYGDSFNSIVEISHNPIDRQWKHEIGFHLSDPCIFEYKGKLVCAYRENTREKGGREWSFVHCKSMSDNGEWGRKELVTRSNKDPLLSPAFFVVREDGRDTIQMIHVNRQGNQSILIRSELDENMHVIESYPQKCIGLPAGYYVWHISVAYGNGRKMGTIKEPLFGLFLLRNEKQSSDFKLFLSKSGNVNEWKIGNEVIIPNEIKRIELHPYKSCFVPNRKKSYTVIWIIGIGIA